MTTQTLPATDAPPVKLKSNARVIMGRALRSGRGRVGLALIVVVALVAVVGPFDGRVRARLHEEETRPDHGPEQQDRGAGAALGDGDVDTIGRVGIS